METIIANLNDRWRVVDDGRPAPYRSWELQYRKSEDKWVGKSFCQTREVLLRSIKEKITDAHRYYKGAKSMPVDESALKILASLPQRSL